MKKIGLSRWAKLRAFAGRISAFSGDFGLWWGGFRALAKGFGVLKGLEDFFFLEWGWAAGFWAGLPRGGGTAGFWAGWGGRILMGWLLDWVAGLGRLGASWAGDWAGGRW